MSGLTTQNPANTQPKPTVYPTQTPTYLIDFMDKLKMPTQINESWLAEVGEQALHAKIEDIELSNASVASRLRKRIPETLSFFETAVLISYIIPFRNIYVSKESNDTILGAFQLNGPKKGIYETNTDALFMLIDRVSPMFKTSDIQETLYKIKRIVPTVQQTAHPDLIIANNGIFNKKTKTLLPFSPDYVFLSKLKINYIEDAQKPVIISADGYSWDVDQWIRDLAIDEDTNTLIWQVIADFIQAGMTREQAIFFYAPIGNNGKGTLGQLLKNIVGKGNYSSLDISDFKHEFLKESLLGVTGNIADENNVDQYIDSVRDFKASITGDDINVNRKFEKPIRLQFRGTNIQMLNSLPKTKDKTDSFYRRIILVPFVRSFTNNGQRHEIKNVYIHREDVLEYVVYKAFNMDFDSFIIPQKSKDLLNEYKELNNPVLSFWAEFEHEFAWDLLPTQFLYDLFVSWSKRTNPSGKPLSKSSFLETMRLIGNESDIWESKFESTDKVKTMSRMDKDEPLITEYNLTNWINPDYHGSKSIKAREFKRRATYRGMVRK